MGGRRMSGREYRLYSSLPGLEGALKWARIDLCALQSNYATLCRALSQGAARSPRVIAVVKADAYGHGAPECVRALLRSGCDFFAVSSIEEAMTVRAVCDECSVDADVMILGYTDPSHARLLSDKRLIQSLLSEQYAERLNDHAARAGVCVRSHVAVNTGMNRIGFEARSEEEIKESARAILRVSAYSALDVCGMFTHLARADEEGDGAIATRVQMERYRSLRGSIEALGLTIPFHHVCNSAAALREDAEAFDGVRLGILLYGACPALHRGLVLRPVMRLEARILHVHKLLAGECVGYGGEFCAETEREIAVIGIGYADGWLRAYGGASVLVNTESGVKEALVVGRICMDQCMLDVTGIGACVGDTVSLFGEEPRRLAMLSQRASSIDYEVLCAVSSRVLRVYEGGTAAEA